MRRRPAPSTFPPRCRPSGSQAQNRMRDGARSATLGHSRPFQAPALWGVPAFVSASVSSPKKKPMKNLLASANQCI